MPSAATHASAARRTVTLRDRERASPIPGSVHHTTALSTIQRLSTG